MITLKKDERLVYAGEATLRAPDGTPLPAVPTYKIVKVEDADPTAIYEVCENERILYGGHEFTDKKRAEERFAALKEGRPQPPREIGTPLYFIEKAENINSKTGRTAEGDEIINILAKDLAGKIAVAKRREKASLEANS